MYTSCTSYITIIFVPQNNNKTTVNKNRHKNTLLVGLVAYCIGEIEHESATNKLNMSYNITIFHK